MQILESIFYGIVSGLSEFLPISSTGHQALLRNFFGVSSEPLLDLLVHIGLLLAVLISSGTYVEKLKRQIRNASSPRNRRSATLDRVAEYDNVLLRSATIPMLLFMIVFTIIGKSSYSLIWIALFFVLNGIIIYIPEHLPHGNKDARSMSRLDSILIGLSGALSLLPGFSRVGVSASYAIGRGADKSKTINWVLVLSIPALIISTVIDLFSLFFVGIGEISFGIAIGYLLAAVFTFGAAILGISLVRYLTARSGFSAFGFYSWGAAFLSFVLYLTA